MLKFGRRRFASPQAAVVALALVLASAIAAAPSFSFDAGDVKKARERAEEFSDRIPANNAHRRSMEKEAARTFDDYRKNVRSKADSLRERMHFDGDALTLSNWPSFSNSTAFTGRYLADDERIYIFVSSSVPEAALRTYAESLDRLRDPNIVMLLRGCIGGCKHIMPTVAFLREIVAPSEDRQLLAEFHIDPFLFRLYGIEQVPAVVFAHNVSKVLPDLSDGNIENLEKLPEGYALYGDVSLDYALEKINEKAESPRLSAVVKELRKGWFDK